MLQNGHKELSNGEAENGGHTQKPICQILMNDQSPFLKSVIEKGVNYLNTCCDPLTGIQDTCIGKSRAELIPMELPHERFTSAVALDLLSQTLDPQNVKNLQNFIKPEEGYHIVNFYKSAKLLADDADTNSVVMAALLQTGVLENGRQMRDIARVIFLNKMDNGIIDAYIAPRGFRQNRKDPCILANVMKFLYLTGYEVEATKSEDWLFDCLQAGGEAAKSGYYVAPESFLYFLSRAVVLDRRAKYRFEEDILEQTKRRLGCSNYPIDIAMRILALESFGELSRCDLKNKVCKDIENLAKQQRSDGSFPRDSLFKKPRCNTYLGGSVISTIFAVAAIQAFQNSYNNS